ncbi:MAG: ABC transporter permease, partial [Clostridia bacterium]|nr:ABC transporter permease [Clostridia bacterium]MDY6184472.1 ABC transporter permease [Eubacteriales bacterium]
MLLKSVFRTIRSSFARYLAILAIIALGVGFFAGLRVSRDAMIETADSYTQELHLYDYRLISTYGFTEDDVRAFGEVAGISGAYGSVSCDVLVKNESGSDCVLHAHTYLDGVNGLDLVAGRLPENETECVLDARYADENMIGRELVISENMPAEEKEKFSRDRYTVVGIANAAYYLNFERGITSLAGGKVSGFVYLTREAFTSEVSTELYLTLPPSGEIYSEEYEAAVDGVREAVEELLETRANDRFSSFVQEKTAYLEGVQAYLDSMASMLPPET